MKPILNLLFALFIAAKSLLRRAIKTTDTDGIPKKLIVPLRNAEIMGYNVGMDGGTSDDTLRWAENVVEASFASEAASLDRQIKTTEIAINACEVTCQMTEEDLLKREAASFVPEKNQMELEIEKETKEAELKKANKEKEKINIKKRKHALFTELNGNVGGRLKKGLVITFLFVLIIIQGVEGMINYTAFLGMGLHFPVTVTLGLGTSVFIGFLCFMTGVFMRLDKKVLSGGIFLLGLITTGVILFFRHSAEVELANIVLLDTMNIIFYIVGTIMSLYINFYTYKTMQYWAEVDQAAAVDAEIAEHQTTIDLAPSKLDACNLDINAKVFTQMVVVRDKALEDLTLLNSRLTDLQTDQKALAKHIPAVKEIFNAKITAAFKRGQIEAN